MKLRIIRPVVPTLAVLILAPAVFALSSFTPVGDLPGGTFDSQVRAADETGGIAVGTGTARNSIAGGNGDSPVYWTTGGGMVELPSGVTLTNPAFSPFITASDITPDGAIVAGRVRLSNSNNQRAAALWTNGGTTLNNLGFIPGVTVRPNTFAAANALSDDGSIVYGFGTSPTPGAVQEAFKWTSGTGIVALGFLNPGVDIISLTAGRGTSADGSKAVGTSGTNTFGAGGTAFLYKDGVGMQSLGYLSGGTWSSAEAISADGTTIFGVADSPTAPDGELFKWTQGGGMVGLGSGFDLNSFAGANSNGTIAAVGNTLYNSAGLSRIDLTLAGAGLNVTGWSQFSAFGISDNGNVLWGLGLNPSGNFEGWVATFDNGFLARSNFVPEASSTVFLMLLSLGLLGAARVRGRRQTRG
jgi:uncharacterized membrane protein